tara:strand:- start:229 stop:459 length:231 start_codon:yes stop_codon:yes gene_type:complete
MLDETINKEEGVIKMYDADKGFGFIKPDSGEPDVFMHVSQATDKEATFSQGQTVRYLLTDGKNDRKSATEIEILYG